MKLLFSLILWHENTIDGFLQTIKLGVTTLEMDVVITKDLKVIVSHEPWISSKKCFDKRGNDISSKKKCTIYNITIHVNFICLINCFIHP